MHEVSRIELRKDVLKPGLPEPVLAWSPEPNCRPGFGTGSEVMIKLIQNYNKLRKNIHCCLYCFIFSTVFFIIGTICAVQIQRNQKYAKISIFI